MKKITKRLISLTMTLIMLLQVIPVDAASYCDHSSCNDYYVETQYEPNDETTHIQNDCYESVCNECGKTITSVNISIEDHYFNLAGKCVCGYEGAEECSHNTLIDRHIDTQYGWSYGDTHTQADQYERICMDCGEITGMANISIQAHQADLDGKCDCGYSKKTNKPSTNLPENTTQTEEISSVEIVNYSVELDNSQDYVTIKAEGSAKTTAITIGLKGPTRAVDSINVQSQTAEAKFRIPFANEEVEYTVLIVAYGKDMLDCVRIDETFTANNSKTLLDRIAEGATNVGATTFGFVTGFINAGVVEPIFFASDVVDKFIVNAFDKSQYEYNAKWRNSLEQSVDEFFETRVSDESVTYYYYGSFTGETVELAVGLACVVNGVKGIVKNVATHVGGVKVASIVLENGDEALALASTNSDDFVMITSQLDDVVDGISDVSKIPDKGFSNFDKLKKYLGKADDGYAWHHIVEKSQIDKAGFAPEQIHNLRNIVQIPSGYSRSVHAKISGYYSSIQPRLSGNQTVRGWLSTKTFEEQLEFGLDVLRQYGTLVATENGWIFTSFK